MTTATPATATTPQDAEAIRQMLQAAEDSYCERWKSTNPKREVYSVELTHNPGFVVVQVAGRGKTYLYAATTLAGQPDWQPTPLSGHDRDAILRRIPAYAGS